MTAFLAGTGMVADLVGGQAVTRADVLRDVVQIARDRLIGGLELSGRMQVEKRRPRFDRQLIE